MAPSTEGGAAGRTSKRLDALGLAVLAIADESMDLSIGDPGVWALLVGTGETLRVYADGELLAGFSPRTRAVQAEAPVLHSTRQWRRDGKRGNRLGSGA